VQLSSARFGASLSAPLDLSQPGQAWTMFLVARVPALLPGVNATVLGSSATAGSLGVGWFAGYADALVTEAGARLGGTAPSAASLSLSGGQWQLYGYAHTSGGSDALLHNGVIVAVGASAGGPPGLVLGGLLESYVAELLVFTALLSVPLRQDVEGYLAQRYGIALAAPHPYGGPASAVRVPLGLPPYATASPVPAPSAVGVPSGPPPSAQGALRVWLAPDSFNPPLYDLPLWPNRVTGHDGLSAYASDSTVTVPQVFLLPASANGYSAYNVVPGSSPTIVNMTSLLSPRLAAAAGLTLLVAYYERWATNNPGSPLGGAAGEWWIGSRDASEPSAYFGPSTGELAVPPLIWGTDDYYNAPLTPGFRIASVVVDSVNPSTWLAQVDYYFNGGQMGTAYASPPSTLQLAVSGYDGYYLEVLLWSRALTPSERLQAEGYLAAKYGLGALLAAGRPDHPYAGVAAWASPSATPTPTASGTRNRFPSPTPSRSPTALPIGPPSIYALLGAAPCATAAPVYYQLDSGSQVCAVCVIYMVLPG
jgi:hypothetical protein